jgi:hypothetical protein
MTSRKQFPLFPLYVLLWATFESGVAAQEATKTEDPFILGKWTVIENSKNGPITLVKEHVNGTTTLTAFDATKRVLYAKTSQYHTEKHGKVKVFVFSNSQYTAGPDAGKTDKQTRSYIYRVEWKSFYEVRGMVDGVEETPGIVVWERV